MMNDEELMRLALEKGARRMGQNSLDGDISNEEVILTAAKHSKLEQERYNELSLLELSAQEERDDLSSKIQSIS